MRTRNPVRSTEPFASLRPFGFAQDKLGARINAKSRPTPNLSCVNTGKDSREVSVDVFPVQAPHEGDGAVVKHQAHAVLTHSDSVVLALGIESLDVGICRNVEACSTCSITLLIRCNTLAPEMAARSVAKLLRNRVFTPSLQEA
jgi:hypothetical protein